MESIYYWCTIVGATICVGQFVLSLLTSVETGLDLPDELHDGPDHHDLGAVDHGDMWFVGMFSIRAISAGAIVFGLCGQATASLEAAPRMIVALAGGFGTMYLMGWLIRAMHKLESDGTVHLEDAVGMSGKVYLPVPESGKGKVTVIVKERTMEYEATSPSGPLEIGTPVVVTGVVSEGVVEVEPVHEPAVS